MNLEANPIARAGRSERARRGGTSGAPAGQRAPQNNRAFWLRHLHQWHWVSAALSLMAMILFTATGITLNHAGQIEARPSVTTKELRMPQQVTDLLAAKPVTDDAPVSAPIANWIRQNIGADVRGRRTEWSDDEVYVSLPRAGGDAWLSIDRTTGDVKYELTDRGWIAFLNDLHKGRNTGLIWQLFIDAFALACLIFCVTGLLLMKMHARTRPSTWPIVGMGVVLPLLLIMLFVH